MTQANEKYKGDALLQKCFTVEFLTKKQKINEGEVPQYYVENSHEAIINPQVFELVQQELKKRLQTKGRYSGVDMFSSKIKCGECGKGLVSPKIPPANQLIWEAFEAAVEVVVKNGGKATKGKARSGAKLGSDDLPLDSVEGYIAFKVHGVKEGETAFGPGFVICAVLDWAEICKNERGYLTINPLFNL